jgi:SHOCT-like domain
MTTTTADSRRILELLAQGAITVDEADQLLRAVGAAASAADPSAASSGEARREASRWLRITVDKPAREGRAPKQVSIRVPMAVVRGGARLGAMFPRVAGDRVAQKLREQGIDIAAIDFSQIEQLLENLGETTIDVDEGKDKAHVRITCE